MARRGVLPPPPPVLPRPCAPLPDGVDAGVASPDVDAPPLPPLPLREGPPPPLTSDSLSLRMSSLGNGRAAGAARVGVGAIDELLFDPDSEDDPAVMTPFAPTRLGVSGTPLPTLAGEPLRTVDVRPEPPLSTPSPSWAVC